MIIELFIYNIYNKYKEEHLLQNEKIVILHTYALDIYLSKKVNSAFYTQKIV